MRKDSFSSPQRPRRWMNALLSASLICLLALALLIWRSEPNGQTKASHPSQSYAQALEQARLGKPGAARMLYQQLVRDDMPDERLIALLAELPHYPSPQALKLLDTLLDHESVAVREAAIQSAVRLLPDNHLAVLLGPLLTDSDMQVRLAATLALVPLSPDDLGLYFAALQHSAESLQPFLARQPPSASNLVQLARLYQQTGKSAQALASMEQAVKLQPDDLATGMARVELLDDLGQADKARQAFRSLLEKHPNAPELQHALGKWLREHGQAEFAVLSLARASELAPDNDDYHYDLALALHDLEQLEAAQKQLQQIVQNHPANRKARVLLIQYAREAGQLQNVQVLLAELEQQNPDDPTLQQGL
ncbi:tetratricopeptide repeat protein [uncultured Pseudomonas sp.]|uniref:tetratricopeptide repeat protein n=1 Tax=uncultured Pseudomonas sp. TaxID=114707 RepID=UPI0025EB167B|nr:tetratricopeptide repeat protein [uncultured Pseudomonas sp.]